MGSRSEHQGSLSLGAFVVRLRPGCACVCCGAALREAEETGIAGASAVRGTSGSGMPAIATCPRCGCEVAEAAADEEWLRCAAFLEPAA